MRVFLTGASGFVGTHLRHHLEEMGDEVDALGDDYDLGGDEAPFAELRRSDPEVVYHLAALTHVGRSWQDPVETYRVNVLGTVRVLEAVAQMARPARVVVISSSEVYGKAARLPVSEQAPLRPVTPYAASKVAAEFAGLQYALGRGLEVVAARPFNHVGPGQAPFFVVSGLARRIVEAERNDERQIRVGNLSSARDFTDVRDVVAAYRLLGERGRSGEAYNVCSGRPVEISSILETLVELAGVRIVPVVDPELVRPVDVPVLFGDASVLSRLTGWAPTIALRDTLLDVLEDWRTRRDALVIGNGNGATEA